MDVEVKFNLGAGTRRDASREALDAGVLFDPNLDPDHDDHGSWNLLKDDSDGMSSTYSRFLSVSEPKNPSRNQVCL